MTILAAGKFEIDLKAPCVMGILNVTAESFSGDGWVDQDAAIAHGRAMQRDGARIVDVGGESTRPGARPVDATEELRRVIPVIEALVGDGTCVSVDTMKPVVMRAALAAGASMINDVSGLRYEPGLADVAAHHKAPVVLMHTRGRSKDMYQQASYHDVVAEILDELRESMAFAAKAGVPADRIILDPGLGFAKETAHSYEALARLDEFAELGRPLLVGPSRKSFLAKPLGKQVAAADRDWATAAAATAAVLGGAHIIRIHAVREMAQVVRVADEIRRYHS